jgi:hypothetical protein
VSVLILRKLVQPCGPRPNKAHPACENVKQLWKLVQAESSQHLPERRNARISNNLERRTGGFALRPECRPLLFCATAHGSELSQSERPTKEASAFVGVEDRSPVSNQHSRSGHHDYGREHQDQ